MPRSSASCPWPSAHTRSLPAPRSASTTLAAAQATQVTPIFNSAVETSHTVELTGIDGKATPLALVPGEHAPAAWWSSLPALEAGSYGLRYRLAADGHVTENLLRFRVGAAP
ncbi:MAG: copper resistance protein CopC [Candidatus Binatia bacterium]